MSAVRLFAVILLVAIASCTTMPRQQHVEDGAALQRERFTAISADQFESARFTSSRGASIPYRLLRPMRIVAGVRYPLVIQLHGSGGIGTDNTSQLDRLAKSWAMPDVRDRYPAFVLMPQFPIRSANYGPPSPHQHAEPSQVLNDVVELVNEFSAANPVDRSRIYATGFSMGGSSTWLLPCVGTGIFAAIVPVSGVAPADDHAANFTNVAVLAIHGDADTENPIVADRRFTQTLARAGARHATLREYRGLQHEPPADLYPGFWWRDWLFEQKRK